MFAATNLDILTIKVYFLGTQRLAPKGRFNSWSYIVGIGQIKSPSLMTEMSIAL
jgi:hypothetical protein